MIGVSALIGFRGFQSTRHTPANGRVVLQTSGADREAGAAATSAPVVIGGKRQAARSGSGDSRARSKSAKRTTRALLKAAPARSGLSSPSPQAPAADAPSAPKLTETPGKKAEPTPGPAATAAPDPVGDVLDGVGDVVERPTEALGDVLLDLRDVLP